MGKVVINKEWADLIKSLKSYGYTFETVIEKFLAKDLKVHYLELNYSDITLEQFSRAYLNGFEVEKTPTDIVEEKYKKTMQDMEDTIFHVKPSPINQAIGFLAGIEYVNSVLELGLKLD